MSNVEAYLKFEGRWPCRNYKDGDNPTPNRLQLGAVDGYLENSRSGCFLHSPSLRADKTLAHKDAGKVRLVGVYFDIDGDGDHRINVLLGHDSLTPRVGCNLRIICGSEWYHDIKYDPDKEDEAKKHFSSKIFGTMDEGNYGCSRIMEKVPKNYKSQYQHNATWYQMSATLITEKKCDVHLYRFDFSGEDKDYLQTDGIPPLPDPLEQYWDVSL